MTQKPFSAADFKDVSAQTPASDATAPQDAPEEGGQPDPFSVIEALNAENAALKDKSLRTLADMENLRRRTVRDVADAKTYAVTGFARDVLTVADNIRRALDSVPEEARKGAQEALKSTEEALKALIDGIELTERDLLKTLERHGVRKLEPKGERFDPNLHQAMFEAQNPDVPSGTVVQVVQAGFVIGDRVLRPALVGIAKGGQKAAGNDSAGINKSA